MDVHNPFGKDDNMTQKITRDKALQRVFPALLAIGFAAMLYAYASNATETNPSPAPPVLVRPGDPAPDFSYSDPEADPAAPVTRKLSEWKGKKNVLIAFYPKASTPGCTAQLCGYRDDIARFRDSDTHVIAISLDVQEKSNAFRKAQQLPFPVIGDPAGDIVSAYGIPTMGLMGFQAAKRSVVLIDKQGTVRYVNAAYNINSDKDLLYAEIAKLARTDQEGNAAPQASPAP